MRKCPECNTEIINNKWSICPECGADISAAVNTSISEPEFSPSPQKTISADAFEDAEVNEGLPGEKSKKIRKSLIIFQGLSGVIFMAIFAVSFFMRNWNEESNSRRVAENQEVVRDSGRKAGIEELTREIKKNPYDGVLYYKRGNQYLAENKFKEAIKDYEKALEINKHYVNSYYGIGQAKRRLNDLEGSLQAFDRLVEARPDFWQAWGERAVTCFMLGNKKEFDKCIKKVTDLTGRKGFEPEAIRRATMEKRFIDSQKQSKK